MSKPARLVLVMGGGVSLGSYAGGALTEVFYALDHVSRASSGPAPVQIDVLTGASAGAMSAAVFARALTTDPNDIRRLHDAWVDRISIDELTRREPTGFDPLALLSSATIQRIADDVLTVPTGYQWRAFCNRPLRFAFTLTNLGGLTYPLSYSNNPSHFFSTRIHSDHVRFQLDPGTAPDRATWDRIRVSAIASGAFPGAFTPRRVKRARDEYGNVVWNDGPESEMWYIDGGVLDNEPLGLAKSLVEEDAQHIHRDYRYLLIDPYLNPSDAPYRGPDSLGSTLGGFARAVLGESTAKDWIRANKVNWRITVLEDFVRDHLRPIVDAIATSAGANGAAILAALNNTATSIATFKAGVNRADAPDAEAARAFLERDLQRIDADPRFGPATNGLGGGPKRAMLEAIFILESFAGLRNKEQMPLYLIAPGAAGANPADHHPLAGDFLHNFGGFFRREWREHDFLCGRRDARAVLTSDLRDDADQPLLDYPPEPGVNYQPTPVSVGPSDLTKSEKEKFRDYFKDRFEPILEPHLKFPASLARGTIAKVLANRVLKQIGIDV
ncbi:MAG TPA: DUF3376 domain-containing protein [Longimicrobiales bacterium]|nr:DUF3376 domain-containing protein [Longimicrobiales bacterium]